jgi:hypothetical protein
MNQAILSLFLPLATSWCYWIIAQGLKAAGLTLKWAAKKALPVALLLVFGAHNANAGWFTRGPDPKTEAANRALERAAQIATEAARTQSSQQSQLLQAVEALSNERTHLAAHLEQLGTLAARDSAWAAALQAASPILVAIAVLALGTAAIWMVTRAGGGDSHVASMLIEEIVGSGTGLLIGGPEQPRLSASNPADLDSYARTLAHAAPELFQHSDTQEGELPF